MRVTVRQRRNVETRHVMLAKVMKLRSGKTLLPHGPERRRKSWHSKSITFWRTYKYQRLVRISYCHLSLISLDEFGRDSAKNSSLSSTAYSQAQNHSFTKLNHNHDIHTFKSLLIWGNTYPTTEEFILEIGQRGPRGSSHISLVFRHSDSN